MSVVYRQARSTSFRMPVYPMLNQGNANRACLYTTTTGLSRFFRQHTCDTCHWQVADLYITGCGYVFTYSTCACYYSHVQLVQTNGGIWLRRIHNLHQTRYTIHFIFYLMSVFQLWTSSVNTRGMCGLTYLSSDRLNIISLNMLHVQTYRVQRSPSQNEWIL